MQTHEKNMTKIWLSLCFMGCVRFAWYCGKIYICHLFSYGEFGKLHPAALHFISQKDGNIHDPSWAIECRAYNKFSRYSSSAHVSLIISGGILVPCQKNKN